MFEIYKFEFDNDFISQDELRSYIDMGLITQAEYQKIIGDTNEEAQPATDDKKIVGEAYAAPQAQPAQSNVQA